MTAEDEFFRLLGQLHTQLGHPDDDFDALLAASSLGAPHVQAVLNQPSCPVCDGTGGDHQIGCDFHQEQQ